MKNLCEIRDLTVRFPEKDGYTDAVKHLSFDIRDGEILGVVGESGSGKSMTSLAIMGLLPRDAEIPNGKIMFLGKDFLALSEKEQRDIRGNDISMVFQEPMTSLNPVQKIGVQVGESLRLHTKLSEEEIRERVVEALTEVGLPEPESLMDKYPHELSGGMRQRVMIAMAMICDPYLLIADEPTTALDVVVQAQILKLLKDIHRERKTSILFISHDLNVVRELCDRVIVVYKGEIVEQGDTSDVLFHPKHEYTRHLVSSIPQSDNEEPSGGDVLRLSNLDVYYDIREGFFGKKGKKHVIHGVNLSASDGEIVGIVGESGCGKSTLCKTILKLHDNYTGEVWVKEGMNPQMVFQDPYGSLNPARRIGWILEEPLKVRGIADPAERKRMVLEMLHDVGLDETYLDRRPRELSGGQRQRISIASALLMDSKLIIADEPVSALDVTVQSQILKLLLDLHKKKKMTVLFISHDLNVVRKICRRVMVIYRGQILESGFSGDVYGNPAHPYTKLLLASIVDGDPDSEESAVGDIGEKMPEDFKGCPFYPRCEMRRSYCARSVPEEKELGNGHICRCFRMGSR